MSSDDKVVDIKSASKNQAKSACGTTKDNGSKKDKPLTTKQLHFCRCRASGMNMTDSYREAYSADKMSNKTVNEAACRLDKDSRITARIDHLIHLKEQALIRSSLSLKEKVLSKLEHFMDNASNADSSKIRAAELLGKSLGMFKEVIEDGRDKDLSSEELTKLLEDKLSKIINA